MNLWKTAEKSKIAGLSDKKSMSNIEQTACFAMIKPSAGGLRQRLPAHKRIFV